MAWQKEVEEGIEKRIEKDIEKCIEKDIKKGIEKRIKKGIEKRIEKRIEKGGENDPPEENTVKHFIPSVTYQKMFGAPPEAPFVVIGEVIHEYCPRGEGIWTDAL